MKPEIHSKAVSKGIMWGSLLWRLPVGTGNTRAINVLFGRVCSQLNNHILIQSTATTLSGQPLHVPTRLFAQTLFILREQLLEAFLKKSICWFVIVFAAVKMKVTRKSVWYITVKTLGHLKASRNT
jgi:hypothetical protein